MIKVNLEKVEELDYARNEAFKSLRTNLMFCGDEVRRILLTSCTPNEGKSTVGFYLAKALAEDGKRVVLIDADLRKSVLVGRLGVKTEEKQEIKGLSHYLSGQAKLEDITCKTDIEGLFLVLSGPVTPNPTELLGNKYFEKMLLSFENQADYIIIDAPPLGSVIDAAILTKVCDGSILVVENNRISYRLAQNVKKQLEQTDCKVLGAILNKVDIEKGYYQGYYQGYYKKYYGGYQHYGEY
ncbi:MAG: polysaccharide biosynthesis tyrosine autokinase [Velocimicrobium sp.]